MRRLCSTPVIALVPLFALAIVACTASSAPSGDDGDKGGEGGAGGEAGAGGQAAGGEDAEAGAGGEGGAADGEAGAGGTAGGGNGGAAGEAGAKGGSAGAASLGKYAYCDDPKARIGATDGVHTTEQIALSLETSEPAKKGAPTGFQGALSPPGSESPHWKGIYVPAQYATAAAGEVALWVAIDLPGISGAVRAQLDYLAYHKLAPPIVLVTASVTNKTDSIVNDLLPDVLAKFPKISMDPLMRVISGGSTRGADAFDLAYAKPQLFGLVFSGSGSFVCFQKNYPYDFTIMSGAKKNIRVSMAVGTCDIWGRDDRWPAECGTNCGRPLCIDASSCAANWVDANKTMAKALTETGHPNQLFVVTKGRHNEGTPIANFGDAVRWLFKPRTCANRM